VEELYLSAALLLLMSSEVPEENLLDVLESASVAFVFADERRVEIAFVFAIAFDLLFKLSFPTFPAL
jgi:hypothetical protein